MPDAKKACHINASNINHYGLHNLTPVSCSQRAAALKPTMTTYSFQPMACRVTDCFRWFTHRVLDSASHTARAESDAYPGLCWGHLDDVSVTGNPVYRNIDCTTWRGTQIVTGVSLEGDWIVGLLQ